MTRKLGLLGLSVVESVIASVLLCVPNLIILVWMRRVAFSDGKDGGEFGCEDEVVCILELHVCKVYQGVMFPASKTKSPTLVLVVSRVVMAAIGYVAAVEGV
jgi:hypothetical protein